MEVDEYKLIRLGYWVNYGIVVYDDQETLATFSKADLGVAEQLCDRLNKQSMSNYRVELYRVYGR